MNEVVRAQATNIYGSFCEFGEQCVLPNAAHKKELKAQVKEAQKLDAELRSQEAKLRVRACLRFHAAVSFWPVFDAGDLWSGSQHTTHRSHA